MILLEKSYGFIFSHRCLLDSKGFHYEKIP